MKKSTFFVSILLSGLLGFADTFGFTLWSEAEITQHWQQYSPASNVKVNHRVWDELLKRYIFTRQEINLFAYDSVTAADKNNLENYIKYLQTIKVTTLERPQQFAYWINLYNATVIQVVLNNYPVASIQDIDATLLSNGPWRQKRVNVEGIGLSLDNIEHQILRPIFKDSRIHYAVNCASISCPNLQTVAYTHTNLETLLDFGAKQYINHLRGVWLNNGKLIISSIFDWYAEDFGDNDRQIIDHLMRFAATDLRADLRNHMRIHMNGGSAIDKFRYDWALNEFAE